MGSRTVGLDNEINFFGAMMRDRGGKGGGGLIEVMLFVELHGVLGGSRVEAYGGTGSGFLVGFQMVLENAKRDTVYALIVVYEY